MIFFDFFFFTFKDILFPNLHQPKNMEILFEGDFVTSKRTLRPSRHIDTDPMETHYYRVESRFLRMLNKMNYKRRHTFTITSIDYYVNPNLKACFEMKKLEFQRKYGVNEPEAKPIFGFHGTKSNQNVANIMNYNFKPSKRGKFGAGVYFSEQPAYTFRYGGDNHLVMAQVLPGRTLECFDDSMKATLCTPGYDSHGGYKTYDGHFEEIVIFNQDQILPCYVIYFRL